MFWVWSPSRRWHEHRSRQRFRPLVGLFASVCLPWAFGSLTGCSFVLDSKSDKVPAEFLGNPTEDRASALLSWTQVRRYEITMSADDRAQMDRNLQSNDPDDWEQYFPGELTFGGVRYPNVAIRYKGSYGSLASCVAKMRDPEVPDCDKLSIKLKFNEYDDSARFFGLKRLNFHSMTNDKARMHEVLAYNLFRAVNVPAPRATFATMSINGDDLGVFTLVEQIDSQFLKDRFTDPDGLLFKEAWPSGLDLSDADWILSGKLKTNRHQPHNFNAFKAFAADAQRMTKDTYLDTMKRWLDFEAFERYMLADRYTGNFDGVLAFYCFEGLGGCINHNFYIYQSSDGARHWLIPWDLDLTFPVVPEPYKAAYGVPAWHEPSTCDWIAAPPDSETFIRPPACDPMLGGFIGNNAGPFAAALAAEGSDRLALSAIFDNIDELAALLGPALAADPLTHIKPEDWRSRVDKLKDNATTLHSHVLEVAQSL
jgi:spore coat protein H